MNQNRRNNINNNNGYNHEVIDIDLTDFDVISDEEIKKPPQPKSRVAPRSVFGGSDNRNYKLEKGRGHIINELENSDMELLTDSSDESSGDCDTVFDPDDAFPRALITSNWVRGLHENRQQYGKQAFDFDRREDRFRPDEKAWLGDQTSFLVRELMKTVEGYRELLLDDFLRVQLYNLSAQCPAELWPRCLKIPPPLSRYVSRIYAFNPRYYGRLYRYASSVGYMGTLKSINCKDAKVGTTRSIFRSKAFPLSYWSHLERNTRTSEKDWVSSIDTVRNLLLTTNTQGHSKGYRSGGKGERQCFWCDKDEPHSKSGCSECICFICGMKGHKDHDCSKRDLLNDFVTVHGRIDPYGSRLKTPFKELQMQVGEEYHHCIGLGQSDKEEPSQWLDAVEDTCGLIQDKPGSDSESGEIEEGISMIDETDATSLSRVREELVIDESEGRSTAPHGDDTTDTLCVSCGSPRNSHSKYCSVVKTLLYYDKFGPIHRHPGFGNIIWEEEQVLPPQYDHPNFFNQLIERDEKELSEEDFIGDKIDIERELMSCEQGLRLATLHHLLPPYVEDISDSISGDNPSESEKLHPQIQQQLPADVSKNISKGYLQTVADYNGSSAGERLSWPQWDYMQDEDRLCRENRVHWGPRGSRNGKQSNKFLPEYFVHEMGCWPFTGPHQLGRTLASAVRSGWNQDEFEKYCKLSSRQRYHLSGKMTQVRWVSSPYNPAMDSHHNMNRNYGGRANTNASAKELSYHRYKHNGEQFHSGAGNIGPYNNEINNSGQINPIGETMPQYGQPMRNNPINNNDYIRSQCPSQSYRNAPSPPAPPGGIHPDSNNNSQYILQPTVSHPYGSSSIDWRRSDHSSVNGGSVINNNVRRIQVMPSDNYGGGVGPDRNGYYNGGTSGGTGYRKQPRGSLSHPETHIL